MHHAEKGPSCEQRAVRGWPLLLLGLLLTVAIALLPGPGIGIGASQEYVQMRHIPAILNSQTCDTRQVRLVPPPC